jgi:flagellar hook-length control protein FliK
MDVAAAPPPELTTVVAPQSRGPPSAVRPPGQRDPGGSPPLAPFDLLLQLLGNALPAGQSLPVGGSGLPASTDASAAVGAAGACAVAAAPADGQSAAGAQASPTTLADWLRLELARAGGEPAATTASDAASAGDAAAPAGAQTGPNGPALATAPASADATPIDLQALLGANADAQAQAQAQAQPLAALVSPQRERVATGDSRRVQGSLTQATDAPAPTATSDLEPIDLSALHADLRVPVAVTQIPAAVEKTVRLDENTLPLVVTPTTGADSASAPALPLMHASTATHATSASAAPAQSALPQSGGDAIDTNAARWHDALATRIQWLVDHDIGEAKIKLNPPELGALDVKIALQDDKTYVQVVAHSASARDELAQGLPRLRELLSAGGLELGGATVSGGHDDRGAFGSASPQPITRVAAFASAVDDVRADTPRARLGAGVAVIDTFA